MGKGGLKERGRVLMFVGHHRSNGRTVGNTISPLSSLPRMHFMSNNTKRNVTMCNPIAPTGVQKVPQLRPNS